jgi:uncharacterized protein (DUF1501 family)
MDRRLFLTRSLALGCSAAASPLITPVVFASAPWDNRLVVIILRGAMDGLDAVQPRGDRDYAALRPTLTQEPGLPVSDFWSLHPGLAPLLSLWQAGEAGAVQAVSTPYRDRRSHFDGQDILEAGTSSLLDGRTRDGWLNRMLQAVPGVVAETSYAIGQEQMLILSGAAPTSRWAPEARLALSPATRQLIELVQHDDPLFRDATLDALDIVDDLDGEDRQARGAAHLRLAEFAAARLRQDTRIASFSISGWDTHARQSVGLSRALTRLAETIVALKDGLGPVWGQTAVLCLTEFGRTARENGSAGTDHGTGGAMLYAGGAVRGGQVAGDWPGLSTLYADRDLLPTRDVRAHAGWVMRGLFGLDHSVLEQAVFPDLDLGADPGLLA